MSIQEGGRARTNSNFSDPGRRQSFADTPRSTGLSWGEIPVTPTPMHANPYAQQIAFPVISQPVPRWDYSSATTRSPQYTYTAGGYPLGYPGVPLQAASAQPGVPMTLPIATRAAMSPTNVSGTNWGDFPSPHDGGMTPYNFAEVRRAARGGMTRQITTGTGRNRVMTEESIPEGEEKEDNDDDLDGPNDGDVRRSSKDNPLLPIQTSLQMHQSLPLNPISFSYPPHLAGMAGQAVYAETVERTMLAPGGYMTKTKEKVIRRPGQSVAKQPPKRGPGPRLPKNTCRFIVPNDIASDGPFKAAKVLIGRGGQNMRQIAEATTAKIRVRGKGSGHLEGPNNAESTDPLMCCISCPDTRGYEEAKVRVTRIFEQMFTQFRDHCKKQGRPIPELQLQVQE